MSQEFSSGTLLRFEFDRLTGIFSNPVDFQIDYAYNFEFSPNGQFLYVSGIGSIPHGSVIQFDISSFPDINTILASETIVYTQPFNTVNNGGSFFYMKQGPNGKIYLINDTVNIGGYIYLTICSINNPNLAGLACNFEPDHFITPFNPVVNGNDIIGIWGSKALKKIKPRDTVYQIGNAIEQTLLCESDTTFLKSPHNNITFQKWSTGSTEDSIPIATPGQYWVHSFTDDCKIYIDTFKVNTINKIFNNNNDTTICFGDTIVLNAYYPNFENYIWSNGSTATQINVSNAGIYYVTASNNNCQLSDTITVSVVSPEFDILQSDTQICNGARLTLQAQTNMGQSIHWSNYFIGTENVIITAGKYVAFTDNMCGRQSDSVYVDLRDCDCNPISPTAFTPNNDGKNDFFLPKLNFNCELKYYEIQIFNRYGQIVYNSINPNVGWDGNFKNKPADAGVYFYLIKIINNYSTYELVNTFKGEVSLIR